MTHDLKWLRENALFTCENCEPENSSHKASDLTLYNGVPLCDMCYDSVPAEERAQEVDDTTRFSDLPPFDPFAGVVDRPSLSQNCKRHPPGYHLNEVAVEWCLKAGAK